VLLPEKRASWKLSQKGKDKMKPIIFSTDMGKALLNTRQNTWPAEPIDPDKPYKWMTRRIVNPQPVEVGEFLAWQQEIGIKYQKGDILWVRETFTKTKDDKYIYRADPMFDDCGKGDFAWSWTSPIFLPRTAARIFLEVKNVRIERIQEITDEDAKAEGIFRELCVSVADCGHDCGGCESGAPYSLHFKRLWDHLNAKRGYPWDSNPWVWVYEFMRLDSETVKGAAA
jgi:hypothetical protein